MTTMSADTARPTSIEEIRARGLRWIEETNVAGSGTGHKRDQNLLAVQKFVDGDEHCAWNFKDATDYSFDAVLGMISAITGCSSDPGHKVGDGYISPNKTLAGLEEAAERIADVAGAGGSFFLATGHPGSMLTYYLGIADLIDDLGGSVVTPAGGTQIDEKLYLDYVGPVAVLTDLSKLPHSHDYRQMQAVLDAGARIDLAIVDHGYAGLAIEAGIPTIATMDTNDPALAVWKYNGADLTVIPIDDNESLSAYLPHVETLRAFAEHQVGRGVD